MKGNEIEMKRRKCELMSFTEYDHMPPIAFENDGHKYHKSDKGRYLKATRKTCNLYCSPALFVGIFTCKKHRRVERFCREHAQEFAIAELPEIPEIKAETLF